MDNIMTYQNMLSQFKKTQDEAKQEGQSELDEKKKLHMLNVLIEWQKLNKMLGKKEYISTLRLG